MGSPASSQQNCLPDWWFTSYVLVFVLFAVVVAVLISAGAPAAAAITAPVALSSAAVSALRRLRGPGSWR